MFPLLFSLLIQSPAPQASPALPQPKAAVAAPVSKGSLNQLVSFMVGSFSSADQAKADPENYRDIRLEVARIWPDRTDGVWLYVEQAAANTLDKPYRQRVYHLTALPDGRFCSVIMSFKGDALAYAGAWKAKEPLKGLKYEDVEPIKGCAVFLNFDGKGKYQGATQGHECENKWRGATYATTEVTMTATEMRSWDRGYDPADKQIWGAEKGGYIFKKLAGR
ncbi:MAG: chromophore lyase CpcT/CpeT [Holophaga sp.]